MARNEEGEFELILGNRQLLSVFFIVVVLLGLCFLMGYVIGRNSAPVVNAENVPAAEPSEPLVIPSAATSQPEVTDNTPPPQTTAQAPAESAPLPPPKPAPPETKQEPKLQPKQEPAPATQSKLPPLPPAPGGAPAAGAYLQLSATDRDLAAAYVDRLRGQGFPAAMAQVPGQDRYRVLVGPFTDSPAEISKMRVRLNTATPPFPGNDAIPRRY